MLNRINPELDVIITAVQNSRKCNANTFAIAETNNKCDRHTAETNLFNLDIDSSQLQAITFKLREAGILNADETLEQWLSEMMPQITDGGNLTLSELLAGLRIFYNLNQ